MAMPEDRHEAVLQTIGGTFAEEFVGGVGSKPRASLEPFIRIGETAAGLAQGIPLVLFSAEGQACQEIGWESSRALNYVIHDLTEANLLTPGTAMVCATWPPSPTWNDLLGWQDQRHGSRGSGVSPKAVMAIGMRTTSLEVHLADDALVRQVHPWPNAAQATARLREQESRRIDAAMVDILENKLSPEVVKTWRSLHAAVCLEAAFPSIPMSAPRPRM